MCLLGWKDTGVCTICADGFYKLEDLCPACGIECATCEIEESNCTGCKGSGIGRGTIFADPSCGCLTGYFELGDNECGICDYMCLNCSIIPSNCTVCYGDTREKMVYDPLCSCIEEYFEIF